MQIRVSKNNKTIKGAIKLPASKSISNRLLIINELAEIPFEIENLSEAKDTETLHYLLSNKDNLKKLNVGPAGTTMRFLTAYCAVKQQGKIITGSDRMKQRPIAILVDALQQLGAKIDYLEKDGFPPIKIVETIKTGGELTINGGISSQYITALLLIAPTLKNGLTLTFEGKIVSKPYIQMTVQTLLDFGIKVSFIANKIVVSKGNYKASKTIKVESDWSAASYWYQLLSFSENGSVFLDGLEQNSLQGDAALINLYQKIGIVTQFVNNGIQLSKQSKFSLPKAINHNFTACPDLAQTLAVTYAGLGIKAKLSGLKTLRIKETDRIEALQNELKKLNCETQSTTDSLSINSAIDCTTHPTITTYHDHRMAMAFAPLSMLTNHIFIENQQVVEKSYPSFWKDLKMVGFTVS